MKKFDLENIDKQNVFETPEGYFKDLTSIIQAKAVKQKSEPFLKLALASPTLKMAMPVLLIMVLFVWQSGWLAPAPAETVSSEELLASVSTDDLKDYLLEEVSLSHTEMIELAEQNNISLEEEASNSLDDELLESIDLDDLEELM